MILATGINNRGFIVGSYMTSRRVDGRYVTHAFCLDPTLPDQYRTFDFPGAGYTVATGINEKDEIAGYYGLSSTDSSGTVSRGDHGFISRGGQYVTVDYPDAAGTRVYGINTAGDVVGESINPNLGFIYSKGLFKPISCPSGAQATPLDINDNGEVVGICSDRSGSFILTSQGTSYIDFHAPWLSGVEIRADSVNDGGDIAGFYGVEQMRHGFVLTAGPDPEFISVDYGRQSLVSGINRNRRIIGYGSAPESFFGEPKDGSSTHPK